MTRKTILAPLLLAAALALDGCGYALVGRGTNIPADVKEVYVKAFENRTQRAQVEQALTRAVADELVTRQRFAIVASPEQAQAEIDGVVTGFSATPVTFDNAGRATAYEIAISAQISFKRTGTDGAVLWSNDRYTFRENYPLEVSGANYVDLEDDTIERAAKRFSQTVVSDLLEGF
jgi:outer membrane lipopolysaccharide assembly protein LptE/RlpB